MIPGIEDILHMLLSGQIDQQQAQAWIKRHIEMAVETQGMRDHFAGLAMQGICAHPDTWGLMAPQIAAHSYGIADEMLKARATQ